mgnify:FL=1|tara:strand:- start:738 stop:1490 length:753 start_codon:yes stop_codon:yes gene_type:complete
MDLYSADTAGIQEGNMRTQSQVRRNQAIQDHNTGVARDINNLKGSQQTTAVETGGIQAAQAFWGGSKIPSAVTATKAFAAAPDGASNPTSKFLANADKVSADKSSALVDTGDGVFESESGLAGESAAKSLGSAALETTGKVLGGGAAAAIGGYDIYKDFKAGGIAGDNWASKSSNILQIGGAIADVGGTVFPPLLIAGGVLDLASGVLSEIGTAKDEDKAEATDDKTQASETQTSIAVSGTNESTTGRVS